MRNDLATIFPASAEESGFYGEEEEQVEGDGYSEQVILVVRDRSETGLELRLIDVVAHGEAPLA
jgi:hypothetical protein